MDPSSRRPKKPRFPAEWNIAQLRREGDVPVVGAVRPGAATDVNVADGRKDRKRAIDDAGRRLRLRDAGLQRVSIVDEEVRIDGQTIYNHSQGEGDIVVVRHAVRVRRENHGREGADDAVELRGNVRHRTGVSDVARVVRTSHSRRLDLQAKAAPLTVPDEKPADLRLRSGHVRRHDLNLVLDGIRLVLRVQRHALVVVDAVSSDGRAALLRHRRSRPPDLDGRVRYV
eukprot:scaffold1102_cov256-Pinguiococcus_pyrenoidosus.AAC.37